MDLCVKSAMCLKENYLVKISYIEAAAIIDVLKHMKEEGSRTSKLILETLCLRLSPVSMASLTSKQSRARGCRNNNIVVLGDLQKPTSQ